MNRARKQVSPAMNEDPTTPIGAPGPAVQVEPAGRSASGANSGTTASWGSFSLLACVGHGGFGEVYRAWDPHLQREVALKLLLPGAVGGEAEYEAMLREARALASVRHPNIVPVHGIDRHDGRVGFWTDFVRGKTLSVLVGEQGTFGAREAALIGLDVARALSAVHRVGLLHRDIKAENVMREEGGRILLMDFGLSSLEQRQTNISGTPNYMAPELFQGRKSTVATDMYAMGVLLYFLVAGDYPVRLGGLDTSEALEAIPKRKPLMDLRPDLPESLLRTVSTAMEMDPAKRFQSAGQLANALAESLGTHATEEVLVAPERRPARKVGTKWIFAGLLAAVVVLASFLFYHGVRSKQAHDSTSVDANVAPETADELQRAHSLLLQSYKRNNLDEAINGFQAVLKTDPQNALAEAGMGAAHFIQSKNMHDSKLLETAKQETKTAMKEGPDLAAPYVTLSRIAAFEGNTDLAMQLATEALTKEPRSSEAHGVQGEVYEAQGNRDGALSAYQEAINLAPNDWRWPVSLGVFHFLQGNAQEAIKQFQNGLALAPDNAVVYYDLGISYSNLGKIEDARRELEKSIQIEPTGEAYSALGSVLLFDGKHDQAAEMYKKAIQLNPGNHEGYYNLGEAYLWSGANHREALEAYRKAAQLEEAEHARQPQDPVLAVMLAYSYAQLGEDARSEVFLRQALALDKKDPTVHYIAGEAYEALGKRDVAMPLIAFALAHQYRVYEFERNPRLASLRSDPKFAAALQTAKGKNK